MPKGIIFSGLSSSELNDFLVNKDTFSFIVTSGANSSFIVPTSGQFINKYHTYNWDISWGDGVIETCTGTEANGSGISHVYPNVNTEYEIAISPADPDELGWLRAFRFNSAATGSGATINKNKVLRITSGELTEQSVCIGSSNNGWLCSRMFHSCTKLTSIGNFNLPQGITKLTGNLFHSTFINCSQLETIPTSFFGDLQLSVADLSSVIRPFNFTFQNCSIATGDMAGVPMLQISPTTSNGCFRNTPNVLNVPVNWK